MLFEVNDKVKEYIRKVGKMVTFPRGTVVFEKGQAGDSLYFINSGMIDFYFEDCKDKKRFSTGTFFGELGYLLEGHVRTATAVCATDVCLVELDKQTLDSFGHVDNIIVHVLKNACSYLIKSESELIKELKEKNRQLEKTLNYIRKFKEELDIKEVEAQTDALTGLYNRRCLNKQFHKYVNRIWQEKKGLGLLMIDLDNFKPINDNYGHQIGDKVLIKTATILRSTTRKQDVPCRLGGDEFVVILPEIDDDQGFKLGKTLQNNISEISFDGVDLPISASIGGTLYQLGETPEQFMHRADQNLYRAKNSGKNDVCWVRDQEKHNVAKR